MQNLEFHCEQTIRARSEQLNTGLTDAGTDQRALVQSGRGAGEAGRLWVCVVRVYLV